jgi:hypothetical protein
MYYQWDDVPSPMHREINGFNRYGGPILRIALREAAARIDGDISPEVRVRLQAYFAIDALAVRGELTFM